MISINRENLHLKDIFSQGYYLELGNINYDVLGRLLNYEMISYEDATYFPIQKAGMGSSNIEEEVLRRRLPFLYFMNIYQKNHNCQLFITYGLLSVRAEKKQEVFSPIVLIPVTLYYENERVYIQQTAAPIENQILINNLNKTNKTIIVVPDKLDKPVDIDNFCFYIEKASGGRLHLENYLTFASLQPDKVVIRQAMFRRFATTSDFLQDKLFSLPKKDFFYVTTLNRNQRYVVHSARNGGNIVISGRQGTGKTTALINIAVNAIYDGKRVLYVSNMDETLELVYEYFKLNNLCQYAVRLYRPFGHLHQKDIGIAPEESYNLEADDITVLLDNYKFVEKYQRAISNRILDYRFIEAVNELLSLCLSDVKSLDIDDLSNIYKADYLEIIKSLEIIQTSLEHMDNFKNSIWKDIPLFNNIKYPNQIMALISQVEQCFKNLGEQIAVLENEYGFLDIKNYAYLKGILHKFMNLRVEDIPQTWLNEETFEEAKEKFRELKNDIYQLQEEEYLFGVHYEKTDTINIGDEIKISLGDYFLADDLEPVNRILANRDNLFSRANRAALQCDVFKKAINKLKNLLKWQFTIDNYILDELTRLEELLKSVEFNRTILNGIMKGRYPGIITEAKTLTGKIEAARRERDSYLQLFASHNLGELEEAILAFDNFRNSRPVRRGDFRMFSAIKENDHSRFERMSKASGRFREINTIIITLQERFFTVTGYEYSGGALHHMNNLYLYFMSLKNDLVRSKIAKFLHMVINKVPNKNYRRVFTLFSQSYIQLNEYYELLGNYGLTANKNFFLAKVEEIKKANAYLLKLFASNDRVSGVHRNYKGKYIALGEYLKIEEASKSINGKKQKLSKHKRYNELFGGHYRENKTNINALSRLMQNFILYRECFKDYDEAARSLATNIYNEIKNRLLICQDESNRLNEIFKLYFKIFRDGVSRYYYDSIEENIRYLGELLTAKEELVTYLTITDNITVLNYYRLPKLIDYIINGDHKGLFVSDFKYTYFLMIKEMHIHAASFLADYNRLPGYLENIYEDECKRIKAISRNVFQSIRKKSGTRFNVFGIKNLDYNGFIKRTAGVKHLFLCSSPFVNTFINVKLFDLVIIDDAHLLSAEEYKSALDGRHIIVAGRQQLQSAVTYGLLARIRPNRIINFNYRFSPTPLNVLQQLPGLKGRYYGNYYDNFGIEVRTEGLFPLIHDLHQEQKGCKINVFIGSYVVQRNVYEGLSEYLLMMGYTPSAIITLLTDDINISCLSLSYTYDADFNIVLLEHYYNIDQEHLVSDMIDNMILCRKKVIIYDDNDYLNMANKSLFIDKVRSIVNNKMIYKIPPSSFLLHKIADILVKEKLIVYNSNELSLLVRHKNKFFGVLFFWDTDKSNFDILNDYRDYIALNKQNDFKIIMVWAMEASIDAIAGKILEGINEG